MISDSLLTFVSLLLDLTGDICRGAAPGAVGTVSTVPDFLSQDEFFIILFRI